MRAHIQARSFRSESDWMATHLNVHPRAVMKKLSFFAAPTDQTSRYSSTSLPIKILKRPPTPTLGAITWFYMDDLDAAITYLRSHHVRILGEPTCSSAASAGQHWVYFLYPWGRQLELVSFPNGKTYEHSTDRRLWDPR
jgi:hypothetical protein